MATNHNLFRMFKAYAIGRTITMTRMYGDNSGIEATIDNVTRTDNSIFIVCGENEYEIPQAAIGQMVCEGFTCMNFVRIEIL